MDGCAVGSVVPEAQLHPGPPPSPSPQQATPGIQVTRDNYHEAHLASHWGPGTFPLLCSLRDPRISGTPTGPGQATSLALTPQWATRAASPPQELTRSQTSGALRPWARVLCGWASQAGASRLQAEEMAKMGSRLCAEGRGTDGTLPKAQSFICLAQALGLQFKSLFIDSYKGESELLTCLHSTKSICINGTRAELPLSRCRPAGRAGHGKAIPTCKGTASRVSPPWACGVAPN